VGRRCWGEGATRFFEERAFGHAFLEERAFGVAVDDGIAVDGAMSGAIGGVARHQWRARRAWKRAGVVFEHPSAIVAPQSD
jgi:hypothetical protein